jgi:hypothetical protein
MANGDILQIFLDNTLTPASDEMIIVLQEQNDHLLRMIKLLEPSGVVGSTGRQQIHVTNFDPSPLVQQYQTYIGSLSTVISTAESTFNLHSRVAYATLRQQLEFS